MLSEMSIVAGVDEVGRGPLAGPVVAGAVVLPENHDIAGLKDSKKLTKKKREDLNPIILDKALGTGIGIVSVQKIDEINIREATFLAMERALDNLPMVPHEALIDGESLKSQKIPNKGIIKGDFDLALYNHQSPLNCFTQNIPKKRFYELRKKAFKLSLIHI